MGALRRAGVWLGLIEDEQDRDSFYDDEFVDDEDFAVPTRSRPAARPTQRRGDHLMDDERYERARDPRLDSRVEPRPEPRDGGFERDPRLRSVRGARETGREHSGRDRDHAIGDHTIRDHHTELDEPMDRPAPPRRPPLRLAEPVERDEPPSMRPLSRPTAGSTALSVPAQEGLALAPPVQLRERAAAPDDRLTRRYEITTLHPTGYSEARVIGEQFRDGHPVLMNLTDLAEADAKRLVDFAAGLAFGLRGSMDRVTNRVFLLTPPNIRVSDEDKQRMAEPGYFDQR